MQLGGVSSRGWLSEISNHLQQLLHTGRREREGGRRGREGGREEGVRGMGRKRWHLYRCFLFQ